MKPVPAAAAVKQPIKDAESNPFCDEDESSDESLDEDVATGSGGLTKNQKDQRLANLWMKVDLSDEQNALINVFKKNKK